MSDDFSLQLALDELAKARRLILWLAKAYGDNNPVWNYETLNGNELPENKELAETWYKIVRNTAVPQ